jgi:bifunctional DNA-binding transcriptional regulator/antitoxin component of YhaV-PrlF toxin-antitoxin module
MSYRGDAMSRAYMVQENGQVTLPIEFRRKYAVQKGDWVVFQETDEGLLISPDLIKAARNLDKSLSLPRQADGEDENSSRD